MEEIHTNTTILSPQDALVAIMLAEGASDQGVTDIEFEAIVKIVKHLPIFKDYSVNRIKLIAETVYDLFEEEDGLDALFGLIKEALPEYLNETAYALACDVAATDGRLKEIELQLLAEIRYELNIDRLHGAAIERGARARYIKVVA
jgi:tellurite resistance protein